MVFNFVDEVVGGSHVGFPCAKTKEGALGDGFCHWGFADYEDVFCHGFVPEALLGVDGFDGEHRFFHPCAIYAVRHVERIQTRLGIDLKDVGIGAEHVVGRLSVVDEAGFVDGGGVVVVEEVVASECVA